MGALACARGTPTSPRGCVTRRNPICLGFPMSSKTPITVAHGDGIGPEIMAATLHILEASGAALEIETIEIGEKVYLRGNTAGIDPSAWESLRRTKVFLKAPITTPQGGGFKSLSRANVTSALRVPFAWTGRGVDGAPSAMQPVVGIGTGTTAHDTAVRFAKVSFRRSGSPARSRDPVFRDSRI